MLSDLRKSGPIEQYADVVIFLYRPDYYGISEISDNDGAPMPASGIAELIIAKHKNGTLENVLLKFNGRYTKFSDFEGDLFVPISGLPPNTITEKKIDEGTDDFFGNLKTNDPFEDD